VQKKRISHPNDQKQAKQDQLTSIAVRVFAIFFLDFINLRHGLKSLDVDGLLTAI